MFLSVVSSLVLRECILTELCMLILCEDVVKRRKSHLTMGIDVVEANMRVVDKGDSNSIVHEFIYAKDLTVTPTYNRTCTRRTHPHV